MILISLFIILTYIITYVIKFGIPRSLSATYYDTKEWFSICLFLSSALMLPSVLDNTEESYKFLPFLVFVGFFFVSASPDYQESHLVDRVHMTNAYLAFICSQLWVYLINPLLLLVWIPIILYIIYYIIRHKKNCFKHTNIIFWSELVMLVTIYYITI